MQRMGVAYSCVEPLAALFGVRASVPALRQHCTTAQAPQAGQTGAEMWRTRTPDCVLYEALRQDSTSDCCAVALAEALYTLPPP